MVETSVVVADAQVWFFMWQDNCNYNKSCEKTITSICISTFYHLQGLLVTPH